MWYATNQLLICYRESGKHIKMSGIKGLELADTKNTGILCRERHRQKAAELCAWCVEVRQASAWLCFLFFLSVQEGRSRWSLAESSGALSVTLIPSVEICLLQLRTAICFQPIHLQLKQLEHFALNRTARLACVAQPIYRFAIKPSEVGFNHAGLHQDMSTL